MQCSNCGKIAMSDDFTKSNRSKDGKKALCKECKKVFDQNYRAKKDEKQSKLEYFELAPDLLSRNIVKARIGVLILNNIVDRATNKKKDFHDLSNFGLKAILSELNEPYEFCHPEDINRFEIILISLTSVMDVENLIYTMEKFAPLDITTKIIVGGFGVCNIKLIVSYIDVAVFGRAEGQINDVIAGKEFTNVWRKTNDPYVTGHYYIRQPRYLLSGENSIGCRNKCLYCQYSWSRRQLVDGDQYNPGNGIRIQETDWHGLTIEKAGRYISALDGWSEETRLRVNKRITNNDIINKILEIDSKGITGSVVIKVFQIVGYPWETVESVEHDVIHMAKLFQGVDQAISTKIRIEFLCTPFGAEPLTPMQYDMCNINVNWRDLLSGRKLYVGDHISAYILPSISGPFTLLKRILIHRAEVSGLDLFKSIAFNSKLKRMPERYKVQWLIKHGYIDEGMFGKVESAAFDYLTIEPR